MSPLRIVFHSNAPWVPTGYGQQTATFTPRLRDLGHDVAISAFWGLGGQAIEWEGMRVYPADEKWGNRNLARIAAHHQADVTITLMDVWVLDNPGFNQLNLASWVPVDHHPLPPKVYAFFERSGSRPIAMSRFGQQMLAEQDLDALYVPHGIDTNTFRPRPEVRDEVRDLVGLPRDAFVVGMVAANKGVAPPRKAFPQVFQAFARLWNRHKDAFLYLHTDVTPNSGGVNLGALAAACGIPPEAIKYTPPWQMELGVDPEDLACIYSAFDVLANPSYGEGFGIPIVEAQACGVPVIVTDHSAMHELCGAGWLVDGDDWYDATQGCFYKCPSVGDLTDAMRQAYDNRDATDIRYRAREFAVEYDADRVTRDFWVPALEQLNPENTGARRNPRRLGSEPWLSRCFPAEGRLALDVGANVGNVTAHLLDGFDEVHAFEPHPDAYEQLVARVGDRAQARQVAVGSEAGELTLKLYERTEHCSAFDDTDLDTVTRGAPVGEVTVPVVTLDGLGYHEQPVDFVKVDTEGYEYEVLKGALQTLHAQHPTVLVEVHTAENGHLCLTLLRSLGYEVTKIPHPHQGVPAGHHWLYAPARVPAEKAVT